MKKLLIGVLIAGAAGWANADDFTDTIENASKAYAEGDISGAREELSYATQLLGQMRATQLQGFLPEAPEGWTKKDSEGNSAGVAMFGGGTTANADYRRGKDSVNVSIVTDSPMLASMSMLFTNPAMAGSQGSLKRINRQKVLIKNDGSITAMIDKRIMVEVKGRSSAEDKEAFFKAIDINGLKDY